MLMRVRLDCVLMPRGWHCVGMFVFSTQQRSAICFASRIPRGQGPINNLVATYFVLFVQTCYSGFAMVRAWSRRSEAWMAAVQILQVVGFVCVCVCVCTCAK